MPRKGYSKEVAARMSNPDTEGLGVELGRLCLLHDYSVTEVAEVYEVTRQTVYNWFSGKSHPSKHLTSRVQKLVDRLKAKTPPESATKNE
jgi:predicted DNA-binding protein YlxM (UPF0122 family)